MQALRREVPREEGFTQLHLLDRLSHDSCVTHNQVPETSCLEKRMTMGKLPISYHVYDNPASKIAFTRSSQKPLLNPALS
jgi:hypothetical protein